MCGAAQPLWPLQAPAEALGFIRISSHWISVCGFDWQVDTASRNSVSRSAEPAWAISVQGDSTKVASVWVVLQGRVAVGPALWVSPRPAACSRAPSQGMAGVPAA